jgi:pilus assembly protein Flp/PilA
MVLKMLLQGEERTFPAPLDLDQEKGSKMKNLLTRLWREEEGQDLTEYALLLVLISLALVGALKTLATDIATVFGNAATTLT